MANNRGNAAMSLCLIDYPRAVPDPKPVNLGLYLDSQVLSPVSSDHHLDLSVEQAKSLSRF